MIILCDYDYYDCNLLFLLACKRCSYYSIKIYIFNLNNVYDSLITSSKPWETKTIISYTFRLMKPLQINPYIHIYIVYGHINIFIYIYIYIYDIKEQRIFKQAKTQTKLALFI